MDEDAMIQDKKRQIVNLKARRTRLKRDIRDLEQELMAQFSKDQPA